MHDHINDNTRMLIQVAFTNVVAFLFTSLTDQYSISLVQITTVDAGLFQVGDSYAEYIYKNSFHLEGNSSSRSHVLI